jgi:MFS family permease
MLFLGANVGFFFFATQFMQGVLGYSPTQTGMAFLPAMIVNFLAALAAPRMIARFGGRNVMLGSMFIGFLGLAWLANVSVETRYLTGLAVPMLLIGLGQGGTLGPLTSSGLANVAPKDAGAASGLVNAAHQLGSSLGLGLQIAVSVLGANALAGKALLTHRVGNAMECAASMLVVALLVAAATTRKEPADTRVTF